MKDNFTILMDLQESPILRLYQRAALVKTLALPKMTEAMPVYLECNRNLFGRQLELLMRLDPTFLCWKTVIQFLSGDFTSCSQRLPKSGIYANGCVYEHPTSVTRTKENVYTLLSTPLASDWKVWYSSPSKLSDYFRNGHQLRLIYVAQSEGLSLTEIVNLYAHMMGFPMPKGKLEGTVMQLCLL